MDEGKEADVIFLDFTKAFDTIPLGILLDKLSKCETNRFMLNGVINSLDGRAKSVVANGAISDWCASVF